MHVVLRISNYFFEADTGVCYHCIPLYQIAEHVYLKTEALLSHALHPLDPPHSSWQLFDS